jgi:hypothetical protein
MINTNAAPAPGASSLASQEAIQEKHRRSAEDMSDLLRRYPQIDDGERLELVQFLKSGHPDELARATFGAGLAPRAAAVKKDHPQHFRTGLRAVLPWLSILAFAMLFLLIRLML